MPRIKILSAALWLTAASGPALASAALPAAPQAPRGVVSENRLPARSMIVPYATRAEALSAEADSGFYHAPLLEWTETADGLSPVYSSRFKVPYKWSDRAVLLRIAGADAPFRVSVNGKEAGYSAAGMGRSEFDITPLVHEDYNTVTVTMVPEGDARRLASAHPLGKAGFASAAVLSQPAVRIDELLPDGQIRDGRGQLTLGVVMQSRLLNPKDYTVCFELLSPTGEPLASERKPLRSGTLSRDTLTFSAQIDAPLGWSHETPYLYTVLVWTVYESRVREWVRAEVGLRTVGHSDGRLLVDSTAVPLYGTEVVSSGDLAKDCARLRQLKSQGANYVIVRGWPQPESLYRAADMVGVYVCDQADVDTSSGPRRITRGGNVVNDPAWEAAFAERARDMYYGSRIHPSVVAFSIARRSLNGYCLYETYRLLKSLEPDRAVIYPEADGQWNTDALLYEAPRGESPIASVDLSRLRSERLMLINNNLKLSQLEGTLTYVVRNGRRTVARETMPVYIPASGTQSVALPKEVSEKLKRPSIEVTIRRSQPVYRYDPAPAAPLSRRERRALRRNPAAGTETVILVQEKF